jgi:hypothetical protein
MNAFQLRMIAMIAGTAAIASTLGCSGSGAASSDTANAIASKTSDSADHNCQVILSTARIDTSDAQSFPLTADVDVAAALVEQGGEPELQWTSSEGKKFSTDASGGASKKVDGAGPGFQRFRFTISHDTVSATDVTQLRLAKLFLIPFVSQGTKRLFDHNRIQGDTNSYPLWSGDPAAGAPANDPDIGKGFEIKADPKACSAVSSNTADHACKVVLSTASIDTGDARSFPLTADVDVANTVLDQGGQPALQWTTADGKTFSTSPGDSPPQKVAGARPGFQRFEFVISHDTLSASDETPLESARLFIIPFVSQSNHKLFDHNRIRGDSNSYPLWSGDTAGGLVHPPPNDPDIGKGFQIKADPTVCP